MLKKINIKNFKSFDEKEINLSKLNVLSGINGSGKSTACQALLVLKQYANTTKETLDLNLEPLHLGKVQDIYHHNANKALISLSVTNENVEDGVDLLANQGDLEKDFAKFGCIGPKKIEGGSQELTEYNIKKTLREIKYLAAEREGPRTAQDTNHQTVRIDNHVGVYGEYTNSYLEYFGSEPLVLEYRSHLKAPSEQLAIQTAYWLKDISPNINLTTKNHSETDQVSLTYSFDIRAGKSEGVRPTNIGFGISYVLPVIVMCLTAKPGDVIIIDTPEAHLHPKGQFIMGELIACTAADGVQVIVETHSDHVINGIRVQTIKEVLEPEDSQFYYFELGTGKDFSAPVTIVHNPKINSSGQFDHWPDGFFDEWSYALNEMLRLRGKNSEDSEQGNEEA